MHTHTCEKYIYTGEFLCTLGQEILNRRLSCMLLACKSQVSCLVLVLCLHVHVCMHACAHASMYVFLYMYQHMYVYMYSRMYVYMYFTYTGELSFTLGQDIVKTTVSPQVPKPLHYPPVPEPQIPSLPFFSTANSKTFLCLFKYIRTFFFSVYHISVKYGNILFHFRYPNTHQMSDMCLEFMV